jgi:hypothetical protein
MARTKPLTALTDQELRQAHVRTWKRYCQVAMERNRRAMLAHYGSERPDLPEFQVEVDLESSTPLIVRAANEQEAMDIARLDLCLLTENFWQIEFTDDPAFRALSAELVLDIADAEAAE